MRAGLFQTGGEGTVACLAQATLPLGSCATRAEVWLTQVEERRRCARGAETLNPKPLSPSAQRRPTWTSGESSISGKPPGWRAGRCRNSMRATVASMEPRRAAAMPRQTAMVVASCWWDSWLRVWWSERRAAGRDRGLRGPHAWWRHHASRAGGQTDRRARGQPVKGRSFQPLTCRGQSRTAGPAAPAAQAPSAARHARRKGRPPSPG